MRPHLFALRLLLIITDTGTDKQIHQLFTEAEQPIYYQFRAQGTANTEILDICGLEGSTRVITAALVPKPEIGELFILLENMFEIRKRGKGIALTLPITGIQASMLSLLSEEQEKIAKAHLERKVQQMMQETCYAMIIVAVVKINSPAITIQRIYWLLDLIILAKSILMIFSMTATSCQI